MKRFPKSRTLPRILLCLLATCVILAAEEANPTAPAPAPRGPASPTPRPVPNLTDQPPLRPLHRGTPGGRVDAATRGDGDAISSLYVLAPEGIGATAQAQPSLFWYQTKPARLPFEFALLRPGQAKPVLTLSWPDGQRRGFQRIRLAEHGVSLAPNVDYQWVVALIRDPQSRSRDILSSGWIRRTPGVRGDDAWYDTLEKLSDQIAGHPQDRGLHARRAALLSGVALLVPARAEQLP